MAIASSLSTSRFSPSSTRSFSCEALAPEAEGAAAAGRQVLLQVLDVGAHRRGGLGRRVREIAEHVQVVEPREGPRQIVVDEALRAAHAFEADLDEDAGRVLDVVARRLNQPRYLAELRRDVPGPLRQRRVLEQRLAGEAGRDEVRVVLGAPLPGADLFELEEPRPDRGLDRRPLEPLGIGEARGIDGGQPPRERAEIADLRVDGGAAQVLEQVVVNVNAVEGRAGRMNFVQLIARYSSTKCGRGSAEYMRYNSAPQTWPASSTWSPHPSATSRM